MTDKAIILAAGRGSRLGEASKDRPKCLLPLAGRTLLDWQTSALRAAGVSDITVVRGYRRDLVSGDFKTVENPSWESTNMVASLAQANRLLERYEVVVSYGDIVYHPDHILDLLAAESDVAITYDQRWLELWSLRAENPLDDAETFRAHDGWLQEIGGKPKTVSEVSGQYMGLLKFRPAGWNRFLSVAQGLDRKVSMTEVLAHMVHNGDPIAAVPVRGQWCEVDCEADKAAYERELPRDTWSHDWRW